MWILEPSHSAWPALHLHEGAPPQLVGRSAPAVVVIGNNKRISKKHCSIWQLDGVALLQDTSSNGTFVNGIKLKGQTRPLQPGDTISFPEIIPDSRDNPKMPRYTLQSAGPVATSAAADVAPTTAAPTATAAAAATAAAQDANPTEADVAASLPTAGAEAISAAAALDSAAAAACPVAVDSVAAAAACPAAELDTASVAAGCAVVSPVSQEDGAFELARRGWCATSATPAVELIALNRKRGSVVTLLARVLALLLPCRAP